MGPYKFFCVHMDFNGALWVLRGLYGSLEVLMGPYISFCVLIDSNGFSWVVIGPYSSLWILMGLCGSF